MNELNPLQTLHRHASQFRSISVSISTISLLFLAVMLFISQQRTPDAGLMSLHYIGVVIAMVQIPLSFYIWKYIAQRMPLRYNEQIIVSGFRLIMIIALLLCLGVVLFAGFAAVITGYAYPSAIIGGIALGSMFFHWPGEKRYRDFIEYLKSR
jgi:hypothetical protein